VIEEFGLPRDVPLRRGEGEKGRQGEGENGSIQNPKSKIQNVEPRSPTSQRDAYYRKIFSYVGKDVTGANFWAFGGTARPIKGQTFWKRGDQWMGDPPMEEQGLNSVFDVDRSTWNVIRAASRGLRRY